MSDKILKVPLKDIIQNENHRQVYKDSELSELMVSMKQNDLMQPIGVRQSGDKYEIVFGNRRFAAAQKLGWKTIACTEVLSKSSNTQDLLIANLTENVVRSTPSLMEQGQAYQQLFKSGLTASEVAARMGVSVGRVRAAVDAFKNVPPEFRSKIKSISNAESRNNKRGYISGAAAVVIENSYKSGWINSSNKKQLYELAQQDGFSVRKITAAIKTMRKTGVPLSEAVEGCEKLGYFTVELVIQKSKMNKLGLRGGKSLGTAVKKAVKKEFPGLLFA